MFKNNLLPSPLLVAKELKYTEVCRCISVSMMRDLQPGIKCTPSKNIAKYIHTTQILYCRKQKIDNTF